MGAYDHFAIKGIKWLSFSQFANQGITLATTALMARLLSPSDFGVMGMATVIIGFIEICINLGTSAAIIQKQDQTEIFISSIFWLNILVGNFIFVLLFAAAPLAGYFYREPLVVPIVKVLAANFIISGVITTHRAIIEKKLQYRTIVAIELIAVIFSAFCGIVAALLGQGVWSLVYQYLLRFYGKAALLLIHTRFLPKLRFDFNEIKQVFNFSINITFFNILNYLLRNTDNLLIGRYLGSEALGYYTLAYRLMLLPIQNISTAVGRAVFPIYSKIQSENHAIADLVLKTSYIIALISAPLMLGLMSAAKPFIFTLFGARWEPAVILIIVLAPIGLLQSLSIPLNSILLAKKRSDLVLKWGLISGFFIVLSYTIGLKWGVVGVAIGYTAGSLLMIYPLVNVRLNIIQLEFTRFCRSLKVPIINAVLMAICVLALSRILENRVARYFELMALIGSGMVTYAIFAMIFSRQEIMKIMASLKQK
jgi:PST family polysaccharide transporter